LGTNVSTEKRPFLLHTLSSGRSASHLYLSARTVVARSLQARPYGAFPAERHTISNHHDFRDSSSGESFFGSVVAHKYPLARRSSRMRGDRRYGAHTKAAEVYMTTNKDNRTLGEMFTELTREIRTLVQQEIQLAKTELTEKAAKIGKSAGLIAAGGFIAYGGLLAIIAASVLVLIAFGVAAWAAALIAGVALVGIGYLLIRSGLATLRSQDLQPRQTIETLKEDAQWLTTQTK
jgi:hypothetical protein